MRVSVSFDRKRKGLSYFAQTNIIYLQTDGLFLHSDIIWDKPNAMPESVKDRPTCSHEYIFMLQFKH